MKLLKLVPSYSCSKADDILVPLISIRELALELELELTQDLEIAFKIGPPPMILASFNLAVFDLAMYPKEVFESRCPSQVIKMKK